MVLVTKLMKAPATLALTFALLTGVAFVGCGQTDTTATPVDDSAGSEATADAAGDGTAAAATEGGSDKKE